MLNRVIAVVFAIILGVMIVALTQKKSPYRQNRLIFGVSVMRKLLMRAARKTGWRMVALIRNSDSAP